MTATSDADDSEVNSSAPAETNVDGVAAEETDVAETTAPKTKELYWYVLAAYLAALGLGALAFLGVVVVTDKISIVAVAAVAIVTALALVSLPTFPALYKDTQYLDDATDWDPRWWVYVGGGAGSPLVGFVAGGVALGPRVNLALSVLSWVASVAGMCVLYLYRRHRFVGVP